LIGPASLWMKPIGWRTISLRWGGSYSPQFKSSNTTTYLLGETKAERKGKKALCLLPQIW
jgi:hypothetical protein